jgi:hypothetical protein
MWLQRYTSYLLQRRWQAATITFLLAFVPVLGMLAVLIAGLITLVKGAVEGLVFTIAATAPIVISVYAFGYNFTTPSLVLWVGVGVAVISNVLTWIFAVMLRRQMSWSQIIQIAALLGVLVVSVVHLAYPDITQWWGQKLHTYYTQAAALTADVVKGSAVAAMSDMQAETITVTKQYATGLLVAVILFNALLQLVIARWWQTLMFHPGGLRRELHSIRLSPLAGLLFISGMVLFYLGNPVVLDIMPVLYLLFGAAGMSLVHYFFGLTHSKHAWFWMMLFYITLIIALPTSIMFIAMLALFDVWINMRKRFKKV